MDIITIDGLSGTGKTARALDLARKLGYNYIGIGYIFRAIAYLNIYSDITQIKKLEFSSYINDENNCFCVTLAGRDITPLLHGDCRIDEYCVEHSQDVNMIMYVKNILNNLIKSDNWVVEGRSAADLFSNARIKFFLVCERDERKKRIIAEMMQNGLDYKSAIAIFMKSEKRNYVDVHQSTNPVRCYMDTIIINSTYLKPEETLYTMLDYCLYNLKILFYTDNQLSKYSKIEKISNMNYGIQDLLNVFINKRRNVVFYGKRNSQTKYSEKIKYLRGTVNEHLYFHACSNDLIVKDRVLSSKEVGLFAYFVSNIHQHANISFSSEIQSVNLISKFDDVNIKNSSKKDVLTYNFFVYFCKKIIDKNKDIYNEVLNWIRQHLNCYEYEALTFFNSNDINSDLMSIQNKFYNSSEKTIFVIITEQKNLYKWLIIIQTLVSNIPIVCFDKTLYIKEN